MNSSVRISPTVAGLRFVVSMVHLTCSRVVEIDSSRLATAAVQLARIAGVGVARANPRETNMAKVKPIPDGYRSLTPYLIVGDGAGAIAFYKQAFGASERMRLARPDGKVAHAELAVGDSVIMLADEYQAHGARAPGTFGGSPVMLHLYVEDVDAVVAKATAAGAKPVRPVENQFYGDRAGSVTDPFGHVWHIATHVEDVPPDEIGRRAATAMRKQDA